LLYLYSIKQEVLQHFCNEKESGEKQKNKEPGMAVDITAAIEIDAMILNGVFSACLAPI
jgi:hypothetical protein